MNALTQPLTEYSEFSGVLRELEKKNLPVLVSGCMESQKCNVIAGLSENYRHKLIITYSEQKAAEILEDMRLYDRDVLYYPAKDIIFYSGDIRGNAITGERMQAVRRLLEGKPMTVVTVLEAGLDRLLPAEFLADRVISLHEGDTVDTGKLFAQLTELGYEREGQVEAQGQFAVRGSIIDIYPLTEETPYRIDLWDDEIDTIQSFDVTNQRSIERVPAFAIYPATEFVMDDDCLNAGLASISDSEKKVEASLRKAGKIEEAARLKRTIEEFSENLESFRSFVGIDSYVSYFYKETVSFFDYFRSADSLIILDEPGRLLEKSEAVMTEFRDSMQGRLEKGYILPLQANAIYSCDEILARLLGANTVMLSIMEQKLGKLSPKSRFMFTVSGVSSYNNSFETLVSDMKKWKKNGYRIVLLSGSHSRAARLADDLRSFELPAYYAEKPDHPPVPGEILVTAGNAHRGFEYPLIKYVVVTETDIFGAEIKKKRKKKTSAMEGMGVGSLSDLKAGDYVVHENHGLGIYRGIEQIKVDNTSKDYIKIEYGDGGVLFLPATGLDLIQKYADADAKKPKLNKLNSVEWKNTKSRVRSAVKDLAEELVKLYALRQSREGYRYGKDNEWQREFEELFPFDETDDQLKAIEDTKRDMESSRIMDRLICGDVGYGKTEIALRAAFKAVQESKQVAVLVPTTILAQQHYNTFSQRMQNFPVRIEMLSRFRSPADQKRIIADVNKGAVDIVIGTHKLLSKDISFKRLGLLVVDEEQRFGVAHKEKIKQLRGDVDVLTLTATPIPRTLHMSLTGIRDMSILDEPPVDRMPIQTFVMEHNDEIIREAIMREHARGGQVYYVYNRVQGIDDLAARVSELVPECNVAYAHGQMQERTLEKIMYEFINGEIDVLISTTIIETGIDISNVNTIIIDDSDRLGLSQLYQLRGRVGRSNRTAYAFLMYKRDRMLKETAEKRLAAIREFTELGSGFKIAMRDLEIRGAGNLLGAEQSGHMEAVGYDMYCKMLNAAVKALKLDETEAEPEVETEIDFDVDASLPSTYIKNEMTKLELYKRIALIADKNEYIDMQEELEDRFGQIPTEVENLLRVALIKALAHAVDITLVEYKNGRVRLVFYEKARINGENLPAFLDKYKDTIRFIPGKTPSVIYCLQAEAPQMPVPGQKKKKKKTPVELLFEQTEQLLTDIKELLS